MADDPKKKTINLKDDLAAKLAEEAAERRKKKLLTKEANTQGRADQSANEADEDADEITGGTKKFLESNKSERKSIVKDNDVINRFKDELDSDEGLANMPRDSRKTILHGKIMEDRRKRMAQADSLSRGGR